MSRHPLKGYGMGDFFSDLLANAGTAVKTGAAATVASAASQIMAQPAVAQAAADTGQRVAAEGLAQQLLAQKAALEKTLSENKTYFLIGGGVLAALIAYKILKK